MKLSKIIFVFIVLTGVMQPGHAQSDKSSKYYFFPIRPGKINYLSGTMGEIRSSHFHAAIDIKTGGVEGLPVYASADGYVSRIKVSTGGYGNVLYVQHPNSTTTVYAHLLRFKEDIANYIRKAQYQNQSFEIELFPDKNELTVQKGKVLGLSGNSGSSGGPHLHFEIRNANQEVLNPLNYGFDEIIDNISPVATKIAIVPLDIHSRVNNQYRRFEYNLYRRYNNYYISEPVEVHGNIGIQVLAYDQLNGASNHNGVPYMELTLDELSMYEKNIQKFSFYESRDILAHYDYQEAHKSRQRFQKMYIDDGNNLSFVNAKDKGWLNIMDSQVHQVKIQLVDAYDNKGEINLNLQGSHPAISVNDIDPRIKTEMGYTLNDNTLIVYNTQKQQTSEITVYANRLKYTITPAYELNNGYIYLWNLNKGIPDSVTSNQNKVRFDYQTMIPSNAEFNYYHEIMDLHVAKNSLFDTLFLQLDYHQEQDQEIFTINDEAIPLRKHIGINLKTRKSYQNKDKLSVYSVSNGNRFSYEGGEWNGNQINFRTRSLGAFTLLYDTIPPKISPVTINQNDLKFYISDELSGIQEYAAYVNGEWVLMSYDYKRSLIWSEKLDESKPFQGQVVLTVVDRQGNVQQYKTTL